MIKSSVEDLQFMLVQRHNLVRTIFLPQIFSSGQNVRCNFRLVGQFKMLVGHCPMSDRYFKAWLYACGKSKVSFIMFRFFSLFS